MVQMIGLATKIIIAGVVTKLTVEQINTLKGAKRK